MNKAILQKLNNKLYILSSLDRSLYSKTLLQEIDSDIATLLYLIRSFKRKEEEKEVLSNLEESIKRITKNPSVLESMQTFCKQSMSFSLKIDEILPNSIFFPYQRKDYTKKDILTLTHDFYASLNSYFYQIFMSEFQERDKYILFFDKAYGHNTGETCYLNTSNEKYIKLSRYGNIEDVITCIHEYMHVIGLNISISEMDSNKNLVSEIATYFIEFLAQDYLNKVLKDNDATYNRVNNHITEVDDSLYLNTIMAFRKSTNIPDYLQRVDTKYYSHVSYQEQDYYLTSYIYAIELYHLYLQDKDKALFILKRIIMMISKSEDGYLNIIKRLGLTPNLHLTIFQDNLIKDISRIRKL